MEKIKEEKARKRRSKCGGPWRNLENGFLFIDHRQNLVASATSNDVQCRDGQMIRMLEGIEVKVSNWEQAILKRTAQEYCEDRKGVKNGKMHIVEWVDMEHREKVHEEVQRHLGHLLRSRTENEERRDGGAVQ